MKNIICLLALILLLGCQSPKADDLLEENAILRKRVDLLEIKMDYLLEQDTVIKNNFTQLSKEDSELLKSIITLHNQDIRTLSIIGLILDKYE